MNLRSAVLPGVLAATLVACGDSELTDAGAGASAPAASTVRVLQARSRLDAGQLSVPAALGRPSYRKTLIGDLNGDGKNDVVTFTDRAVNSADIVVIYQGDSQTFTRAVSANSQELNWSEFRDIAIADMNGDGRLDLVVTGVPDVWYDTPLAIFYQDAAGNLTRPVLLTVPREYGNGMPLALGDVNGDGRVDIALSTAPILVMLQKRDGTFGLDATSIAEGSYALGQVTVADMDSDGLNDIVFQAGPKTIGVLKQTARGVFANAPDLYPVTTSYVNSFDAFAVGDLNGDGKNDIAVQDPGNNGLINVFLQNERGKLDAPTFITSTLQPLWGIQISDLDQDGLNDILAPAGDVQVHVFYQNPDHTFRGATVYTYPTHPSSGGIGSPYSLSVGDVNSDGWPDAVLSWGSEGIYVLTNVQL